MKRALGRMKVFTILIFVVSVLIGCSSAPASTSNTPSEPASKQPLEPSSGQASEPASGGEKYTMMTGKGLPGVFVIL